MKRLRIIVGCELSQIVMTAFLEKGHDAYSCDTEPCEGNYPERHFREDILQLLKREKFDLGIFHPPCTYLVVCRNKYYKPEYWKRFPTQFQDRENAVTFFMDLMNVNINKICLENPVGIMSTRLRKPDQYIQPFQFGDTERKTTGLWLKNLPKLLPTNIVKPELYTYKDGRTDGMWHVKTMQLRGKERMKARSKTYQGIADAMANQWG